MPTPKRNSACLSSNIYTYMGLLLAAVALLVLVGVIVHTFVYRPSFLCEDEGNKRRNREENFMASDNGPLNDDEIEVISSNCGAYLEAERCHQLKDEYVAKRDLFKKKELNEGDRRKFLDDSKYYRQLIPG